MLLVAYHWLLCDMMYASGNTQWPDLQVVGIVVNIFIDPDIS